MNILFTVKVFPIKPTYVQQSKYQVMKQCCGSNDVQCKHPVLLQVYHPTYIHCRNLQYRRWVCCQYVGKYNDYNETEVVFRLCDKMQFICIDKQMSTTLLLDRYFLILENLRKSSLDFARIISSVNQYYQFLCREVSVINK